MPRKTDKDRVRMWSGRVTASGKAYDAWAKKFSVEDLEQFYRGFQWSETADSIDHRRYVINEFYSSIKVRQPSLLFFRPRFQVEPRPARADDDQTVIEARARLQEDTLNTFVTLPSSGFEEETEAAILDAHFRFGVIEVGWSVDTIENPNAGRPALRENPDDPNEKMAVTDSQGREVIEPALIPSEERCFLKWIPAETFRVSVVDHYRLDKCDWCGYFEWHHIEDLKRNRRYKNTSGLKRTGKIKDDLMETTGEPDEDRAHAGMLKVWKIWDLRTKMRRVFAEGHDKFFLEEPYEIFPFPQPLKLDRDTKRTFFPIPPTFNWIDPQREMNDIRDKQRAHRLKFLRKYAVNPEMLESDEELEKFEEPEDGMIIRVQGDASQAIQPIQDAPQDRTNLVYLNESRLDFREVSGISAEDRGIADADTATQANIIAARSQVRESFSRVQVARWLAAIGGKVLETLKEFSSLGFWVEINVDPMSPNALMEALEVAEGWQMIQADQLGNIHNDITVAVESLSPVAQEAERNAWNQVIALVTNPTMALFLSQSETLLRKTVGFYGIKSDKEINEIRRAMEQALMIQTGLQQQAAGAQSTAGGSALDTPSTQQIQSQIQGQLPQ